MTAETPFSRRRLLQSGAALGTLALAGCSGGGSSTPTNRPFSQEDRGGDAPAPTETETPVEYTTVDEAEPTATVGEIVADEKLALVVRGFERQSAQGLDQELLMLDLGIKNRTVGEYISFSNMRMHLEDEQGETYRHWRFGTDVGAEVSYEQLAPGEVVWSSVPFQAPADPSSASAVFTFETPSVSFDRVTVDLGESVELATRFEQTLDVVTYDVGETVTQEGLSVTLEDFRIVQSIDGAGAAGDGRVYVIPKLSIENGADAPKLVRQISHTSLKDDRGQAFRIDAAAREALPNALKRRKQIAPGNTRTREIPYVVPEAVQSLYFVFDFSIDLGGFRRFWEL
ncbi:DUF4352 domain-containing protein [Halorientalis brevis]|uniref:DUF4352 domain-containing protein n=1 Tax=Halorientalis brevis TaxID=1126241 RepID=A0ABD6C820_9EURY|nr:DUF4352 domain-containing protein [Halorientalis brevis]